MADAAARIVFDHVTKRYPGRAAPAVDDLTLEIPAGEICILVGPSGGGKTTAMKMVNRLVDMGPQTTSSQPPRCGGTLITSGILVGPVDGTTGTFRARSGGRMPKEPCYTHARLGGVAQLVRAAES